MCSGRKGAKQVWESLCFLCARRCMHWVIYDYREIKGQQLQENHEDGTHYHSTVNASDEMQIVQDYEPGHSNIVKSPHKSQTII